MMKPKTVSAAADNLPTTGTFIRKADRDRPHKGDSQRAASGNRDQYQTIGRMDEWGEWSLPVAAMEYVWLYDHRHGVSFKAIADRAGVPIERVMSGVERAEALEIRCSSAEHPGRLGRRDQADFDLIPLFPIGAFTPQSTCSHRDPIQKGSRLCCMVCHASGMDDHPGMRRGADSGHSPEPGPSPTTDAAGPDRPAEAGSGGTRKQRRRRRFAAAAVA